MEKIVTICGPTGIGKTGFAIAMAQKFNGEIIGADSVQIYQKMQIGSAKPDENELSQVPHHLVDFLDPREEFDAGQFAAAAGKAIKDISSRGRLPIVAGGTGLYIRALLHGLFRGKPACEKTLERLTCEVEEKGCSALHDRLQECDPIAAAKIHPNDSFRVVRALEVYETTGRPISERQQEHGFNSGDFNSLTLGLTMDRTRLYDRINKRVDIMMGQGLLKEVADLVEQGYGLELKSMQTIGYRHMGLFLRGEIDLEEAVRLLKRDTRRYAKRQFTWFRKEPGLTWVEPGDHSRAFGMIKEFLT